jgi:hypothetical protein
MGKYSLIVVSGFIIVFGIILVDLNRAAERFTGGLTDHYNRTVLQYITDSGARVALQKLKADRTWRGDIPSRSFAGGTFTVDSLKNDDDTGLGYVKLTARGQLDTEKDTVRAVARARYIPPGVRGAITANTTVSTLGGFMMDGREHDTSGNVITGQGTLAVSTVGSFDQGGASTGGGTDNGVDYPPTNPANPGVYEENAAWQGGFPATPDSVMGGASQGFPEGKLKALAQSGANGGQYVTNPASLTFPLSGVTYVELPSGDTWQSMDFGASTGILVVHNSARNATIKNLNSGTFKGLIIADDVDKIHCSILGGVVVLKSIGNCIGNGTGNVKYCSALIDLHVNQAAGRLDSFALAAWW